MATAAGSRWARNGELLAEDLDHDGDLDLVVAGAAEVDGSLHPIIATFANDGTGTLASPVIEILDGGGIMRDVAAGDLDGDGHLDLVAVEPLNRTVTTFLGDGIGGFPSRVVTPTPDRGVAAVALADMDGDNLVDAVVGVAGSPEGLVLFGDSTGGFPAEHVVRHDLSGVWEVLVTDLDDDGRPDVAFTTIGRTSIMMNRLDGRPHH